MKKLTDEKIVELQAEHRFSNSGLSFARAIEAEVLHINGLTAESAEQREQGKAVRYEYRWLNPANEPNPMASMLEWKPVEPRNWYTNTVQDRIRELESSRYHGKRVYEVRALCVCPLTSCSNEAVAYLDIGREGYIDIGTDKPDEELLKLPPGKHLLYTTASTPPAGVPDGFPCKIEEADFEKDTITLKMLTDDYRIHAGEYRLCAAPQPAAQPVGINGLTEAETNATASVMGLTRPAAQPEDIPAIFKEQAS